MAICGITQCLAHILIFDFVFVAVFQVLAGHSPNKAVVAGSGSGVDAPFRRSDGLLVVQPYEAFLFGLAHQVADSVTVGYVEIEVSFHPACVCVGRHCVPYGTRSQFGESHLQLVRAAAFHFLQNVFYD